MSGRITRTLRRWVGRRVEDEVPLDTRNDALPVEPRKTELPGEILWLLDAPMFIDERQVDAFYDAVVRPDYEGTSLTLSESVNRSATFGGEVTLGAALPWFAKAEATAKAGGEIGREHGQQRTLTPVSNAYRHLLTLALHYATAENVDDRLLLVDVKSQKLRTGEGTELDESVWRDDSYVTASPRALVFLDLPPGTKFIPAALELTKGGTVPLFEDFANALAEASDEPAAQYPGSESSPNERDEYWRWFANKFDVGEIGADRKALRLVEKAAERDRIEWIAYRVPVGAVDTPFLHLHIAARGQYDTGSFAYNFISRGFKHGIRIVGTLKSEPDLNVLAIFER